MNAAIWHDVECGGYAEDLPLWRALAGEHPGPVLDVGAGTGRVTLDLARRGVAVTALDNDPALLAVLSERAAGLPVCTVVADARSFELEARFGLCIVPMQTVQLLGGPTGHARFLEAARRHLIEGGIVAIAIAVELEPFAVEDGDPQPLPDIRELDGIVYASRPTAVREQPGGFVLERLRETISTRGERHVDENVITLDRLSAEELERAGGDAGLAVAGRSVIGATSDYVGSEVVMLRA